MITNNELKELIIQQIDEVDLVDYLGLTTQDIVGAFEEEIYDKRAFFIGMLEFTDDGDV